MELINNMKRPPIDTVVESINKIIDWYRVNFDKATIELIIDARSKLTTYLYTFATYVGETKLEQLRTESIRKLKHHQKRKEFLDANYAAAKAESDALLATEEEMQKANDFEGYYFTLRLMLDQANKVDDVLQQKISILKQEKGKY
jgi:hypothetical protein